MNRSVVALVVSTLFACGGGGGDGGGDIDAPDTPMATLVVTPGGSGTGVVTSSPAGINCGSDCSGTFAVGAAVTLNAQAAAGSQFMGWSGGGCSGTGACTVTLAADTAVTASFEATGTLTVTVDGSGSGAVTSNPAGITCGADCTETYPAGTVVTLTATPTASATFAGWAGAGCSGTASCVVTIASAHAVTATFTLNSYSLDVALAGTGSGAVASAPAGISCGADCTEEYDHGTMVTLTATPSVGSMFAGWTGACTGTGACTVTMNAAATVTATFALNIESVTVMKTGTGTGTVTSSPAGISCGVDCNESYPFGTVVTLTATPATGSAFTGWSGGGCTGTAPCTVTVTMAVAVTATFTLTQHTLTVVRTGTGTGTVTSSPAGITCGSDCAETVNYGTVITLIAAPAVGTTFAGWSGGGCTGTGACVVPVTAATTVTATFTLNAYTLSVVRAGTGSGTVLSSPAGINCGADCAEVYNHGTVITLTATPAAGQTFTGWTGGGCTGTGTCAVTLTAATTVTATFATCAPGTVTFNYTGAMQTFTVPSCVTSITIDAYGAQGGTSTGQAGGQNFTGGLGARARGTVAVSGGQVLSVLVGGIGLNSNCGSGGGGGSFVTRGNAALVVAGGGGGGFHCTAIGGAFGVGGNTSTTGGTGVCGTAMVRNPTAGGSNGNGATSFFGGGGGGFVTSGVSTQLASAGGGGWPSGGGGGSPGGGFGGGGGYHNTCCGGSGGGGGYSGGGGSVSDGCAGGGGGSFNAGTAQIMTASARAGNGVVVISY